MYFCLTLAGLSDNLSTKSAYTILIDILRIKLVEMLADVRVEPLHCSNNYTTLIEGNLPRIDLLCMKNGIIFKKLNIK